MQVILIVNICWAPDTVVSLFCVLTYLIPTTALGTYPYITDEKMEVQRS